jgi:hypothetical protein
MDYIKVFDAADDPSRNLWFLLIGLAPIIIVLGISIGRKLIGSITFLPNDLFKTNNPGEWIGAILVILICSILIASNSFIAAKYSSEKKCLIVEGVVKRFHPLKLGRLGLESFEIDNQKFSYRDESLQGGFDTTAAKGGQIREGLHVRICHRDGQILRLEVAR